MFFIKLFKMEVQKHRGGNFSESEVHILLEKIKECSDELFSKLNNAVTAKVKQRLWQSIADSVNSRGGMERTTTQIKKKWSDLSQAAKRFQSKAKNPPTGGGPPTRVPWWYEYVLDILGEDTCLLDGIAGGRESDDPNRPSTSQPSKSGDHGRTDCEDARRPYHSSPSTSGDHGRTDCENARRPYHSPPSTSGDHGRTDCENARRPYHSPPSTSGDHGRTDCENARRPYHSTPSTSGDHGGKPPGNYRRTSQFLPSNLGDHGLAKQRSMNPAAAAGITPSGTPTDASTSECISSVSRTQARRVRPSLLGGLKRKRHCDGDKKETMNELTMAEVDRVDLEKKKIKLEIEKIELDMENTRMESELMKLKLNLNKMQTTNAMLEQANLFYSLRRTEREMGLPEAVVDLDISVPESDTAQ